MNLLCSSSVAVSRAMLKEGRDEGLLEAVKIIDAQQQHYALRLSEAVKDGIERDITYWEAYCSALNMAARLIEKRIKENKRVARGR